MSRRRYGTGIVQTVNINLLYYVVERTGAKIQAANAKAPWGVAVAVIDRRWVSRGYSLYHIYGSVPVSAVHGGMVCGVSFWDGVSRGEPKLSRVTNSEYYMVRQLGAVKIRCRIPMRSAA